MKVVEENYTNWFLDPLMETADELEFGGSVPTKQEAIETMLKVVKTGHAVYKWTEVEQILENGHIAKSYIQLNEDAAEFLRGLTDEERGEYT